MKKIAYCLMMASVASIFTTGTAHALYDVQDSAVLAEEMKQSNQMLRDFEEFQKQTKEAVESRMNLDNLWSFMGKGAPAKSGSFNWFNLAQRGYGTSQQCGLDSGLPSFDFDMPNFKGLNLPPLDLGCLGSVRKSVDPYLFGQAQQSNGSTASIDAVQHKIIEGNREKAYMSALKEAYSGALFNRQMAAQSTEALNDLKQRSEKAKDLPEMMQLQTSATLMLVDEMQKLRDVLSRFVEMEAAERLARGNVPIGEAIGTTNTTGSNGTSNSSIIPVSGR